MTFCWDDLEPLLFSLRTIYSSFHFSHLHKGTKTGGCDDKKG